MEGPSDAAMNLLSTIVGLFLLFILPVVILTALIAYRFTKIRIFKIFTSILVVPYALVFLLIVFVIFKLLISFFGFFLLLPKIELKTVPGLGPGNRRADYG